MRSMKSSWHEHETFCAWSFPNQKKIAYVVCCTSVNSIRKSSAPALVIALTLLSESDPVGGGRHYPRSERKSLGGCRTLTSVRSRPLRFPSPNGAHDTCRTLTTIMKRFARLAPSPLFYTSYRTVPFPCPLALLQCLHTTSPRVATPLPITATGPPPAAPQPAASHYGERVDRRRRQAELLKRGQDMRASHMKPGTAIKKRFWKDVSVQTNDGTIEPQCAQLHLHPFHHVYRKRFANVSDISQRGIMLSTSTPALFAIRRPKRPSPFPIQSHISRQR